MDDIGREAEVNSYPAFNWAVTEACKEWKAGEREYPDIAGPEPDGCEKWLNND